jgi:hypothetical protein
MSVKYSHSLKTKLIPPIVQNCPKRFSEAIRSPLERVVTFVRSLSPCGAAYMAFGRPGNGIEREGCVNEFFISILEDLE